MTPPKRLSHHRRMGIIGAGRPPSLEIFAIRKDMVNLIVVTGVYMEKVREDRDSKGGD